MTKRVCSSPMACLLMDWKTVKVNIYIKTFVKRKILCDLDVQEKLSFMAGARRKGKIGSCVKGWR